MEMIDKGQDRPMLMLNTLRQILVLLITSYPVLIPVLEQFKEDFKDGLDQITESLPKITEALSKIDVDSEVTEKLTKQLSDAVPELEGFFRSMGS